MLERERQRTTRKDERDTEREGGRERGRLIRSALILAGEKERERGIRWEVS